MLSEVRGFQLVERGSPELGSSSWVSVGAGQSVGQVLPVPTAISSAHSASKDRIHIAHGAVTPARCECTHWGLHLAQAFQHHPLPH